MHLSVLSRWRGRPDEGGGFDLRSSFQFKCPTPGKLTLVKRVRIPHLRDISVVQKNANSPPLSRTRHFRKHNWVAFMIVNISELEKGNGKLYMLHGNLDITMVHLWFS